MERLRSGSKLATKGRVYVILIVCIEMTRRLELPKKDDDSFLVVLERLGFREALLPELGRI